MRPKHHYLWHIAMEVRVSRVNPSTYHVWEEEKFLGKIKRIVTKCHSGTCQRRALERYILALSHFLVTSNEKSWCFGMTKCKKKKQGQLWPCKCWFQLQQESTQEHLGFAAGVNAVERPMFGHEKNCRQLHGSTTNGRKLEKINPSFDFFTAWWYNTKKLWDQETTSFSTNILLWHLESTL